MATLTDTAFLVFFWEEIDRAQSGFFCGVDLVVVIDQFGLNSGQSATTKQEHTEHTLKITRILLSSDFQPAIASLSFLACQSREATLRPLCLMTSFCISATVLQSRAL